MGKYQSQFRLADRQGNVVSQPVVAAAESAQKSSIAAKARPRVLMVGMHLTKTRGGITTLIAEILKSPLKDDFEFVYIASQAEDFKRFRKAFLAVGAVFQFVFYCLLKRPKAVYVHVGSNASLYRESIFIFLAKLLGKKVISHFHAGDIDNYYPFQSRVGQKFIRLAIGSSDQMIAVSVESARQLRDLTGSMTKIAVVPNAIDTSAFNVNEPRENRPDTDAVRLLFVGAVGKLKGEKDLIKALALLRESEPKLKASFLGYGAENLQAYCEELKVEGLIEFLGAVSMDERIKFFKKADVFVLPTYAEAMPMSVIEAMAAGLPTISTTVGGIPELIEDGVDGLLYTPGDVETLAEKISFLLEDKDARIRIGKKAREKAVREMDFRQYAEKLRAHLAAFKKDKKI
jgi:glycosyltransferase involved in cell wall biosynthesis